MCCNESKAIKDGQRFVNRQISKNSYEQLYIIAQSGSSSPAFQSGFMSSKSLHHDDDVAAISKPAAGRCFSQIHVQDAQLQCQPQYMLPYKKLPAHQAPETGRSDA